MGITKEEARTAVRSLGLPGDKLGILLRCINEASEAQLDGVSAADGASTVAAYFAPGEPLNISHAMCMQ